MNVPCVLHNTAEGAFRTTLEDERFIKREIEMTGSIDRTVAMDVIRQLRYLAAENQQQPITLLINSNGGDVISGLAILDTMKALPCEVRTVCVGEASSMAALILAGGEKGHRYVLPNSSIMIHDPILPPGLGGPVLTVDAISKRGLQTRMQIASIMAECTGRTVDEILERTAKDSFFTAEQAVEFGLVDTVIKKWGDDVP